MEERKVSYNVLLKVHDVWVLDVLQNLNLLVEVLHELGVAELGRVHNLNGHELPTQLFIFI